MGLLPLEDQRQNIWEFQKAKSNWWRTNLSWLLFNTCKEHDTTRN